MGIDRDAGLLGSPAVGLAVKKWSILDWMAFFFILLCIVLGVGAILNGTVGVKFR